MNEAETLCREIISVIPMTDSARESTLRLFMVECDRMIKSGEFTRDEMVARLQEIAADIQNT